MSEPEPWTTRADWASGRMKYRPWRPVMVIWIVAFFANLVPLGGGYFYARRAIEGEESLLAAVRREPVALILVPFIIFGVTLIVWAIRITWRARLGGAVFEMNPVPGQLGGHLRGIVQTGIAPSDDEAIRVYLRCNSVHQDRAGETPTVSGTEFMNDRELGRGEIYSGPQGTAIPIDIPIPRTGNETTLGAVPPGGTRYSWTLVVQTVPGARFEASFDVPIFGTARAPEGAEVPVFSSAAEVLDALRAGRILEVAEAGLAIDQAEKRLPGAAMRPPSTRIVVRDEGASGTMILYPATAGFVCAVVWFLVSATFYALLPVLLPRWGIGGRWAGLAWALGLNLLPGYLFLYQWPRRVRIGPEEISVFCGLPFFGARRRLATSEAESVDGDSQRFNIRRRGQTSVFKRFFFVAPKLGSESEARWLAGEFRKALSRAGANRVVRDVPD